ncbi:MAG: hypothetical protein WCE45_10825 [Sedimentisphaerales bacterium]
MDKSNDENIQQSTQESAQDSLAAIEQIMAQTRKAIVSTRSNPLLILWGILWVVSFTAAQFYLAYAHYIFWSMGAVGGVGTFIIFRISHTQPPIRSELRFRIGRRILWSWILLYAYVFIWLAILAPFNGMQINAVCSTAAMFAYIMIGLWVGSYFMVWLGLAVTATTLTGFYFIPHYYCLWMAVTGGGAILCTGLYIRLRWR